MDRDSGLLPVLVAGTLTGGDRAQPPLLAIAVDGVVAGIAQAWTQDGETRFQTLVLPSALRDGANDVAAFELVPDGEGRFELSPTSG